jgi:probable selenium-dependent hydroxylase accessory protein YqeC
MLLEQIESLLTEDFPSVISLCGAGGKTSAIFDLAAALKQRDQDSRIVVLTTTRMMVEKSPRIDHFLSVDALTQIGMLSPGITMVARGIDEQGKIYGFEPEEIDRWIEDPLFGQHLSFVLVEADGANKKPLKAPREGEPRFPGKTQIVLGVLGADAFDLPAVESRIHRLALFLELTGLKDGDLVTAEALKELIHSENGLFKSCPSDALKIILVNKAEPRHEAFIKQLKSHTVLPVIVVERGRWA